MLCYGDFASTPASHVVVTSGVSCGRIAFREAKLTLEQVDVAKGLWKLYFVQVQHWVRCPILSPILTVRMSTQGSRF